jgi:hypothetical protein
LAAAVSTFSAEPHQPSLIFGAGVLDIYRSSRAANFSLDVRLRGHGRWQGFLIGTWATDASRFTGAGLLLHAEPAPGWDLTIGFAPGFYEREHGPHLGSSLQFFSSIEISHALEGGRRLGLSIGHISNGDIGDINPGAETIRLFWMLPLGRPAGFRRNSAHPAFSGKNPRRAGGVRRPGGTCAIYTLVIFTSDNGGMLNEGGQDAWRADHRANGEWLGYKFGAWEGGHRVPFIARWLGRIPAGSVSDQLISNVDLLATIASLTGQKLRSDEGLDSFDILPALVGSPTRRIRHDLVLAPFKPINVALRSGKWVYISAQGDGGFGGLRGGPGSVAFSQRANSDITEDGKIKPDAPNAQLYDLHSDPTQSTNVILRNADVAVRLAEQLRQFQESARTAPIRSAP